MSESLGPKCMMHAASISAITASNPINSLFLNVIDCLSFPFLQTRTTRNTSTIAIPAVTVSNMTGINVKLQIAAITPIHRIKYTPDKTGAYNPQSDLCAINFAVNKINTSAASRLMIDTNI